MVSVASGTAALMVSRSFSSEVRASSGTAARKASTSLGPFPDASGILCLLGPGLHVLEYGKDVAGGVLEPCNGRPHAAGDALLVLFESFVSLEAHATSGELVHGLVDVIDREVQDRVRRRGVVRLQVDQRVPVAGEV